MPRSSIAVRSISKKFISTFFAATLALGLVPAAAFASPSSVGTEPAPSNGAVETEDTVQALDGMNEDATSSNGEEATENNADTGVDSNEEVSSPDDGRTDMAIPAATERVNEDMTLTVPAAVERINEDMTLQTRTVAQAESTRSYFLAKTLESTRTVPIVNANLPLDTSVVGVDTSTGTDGDVAADEEGEASSESDDPDLAPGVIAAESTVVGSFTYLGMTFAIEAGGESVALVATDYNQLPAEFVESQIVVIPNATTHDGIDYYTVSRIADGAFASLAKETANPDYTGCEALLSNEDLLAEASIDAAAVQEAIEPLAGCAGILMLGIPASITTIEDEAFAGADTLQYLVVFEGNPEYASFDGALYSADLDQLRLIPEGRVGTVCVAPSAIGEDLEAFSHCPSTATLIADADGAAEAQTAVHAADQAIAQLTASLGSAAVQSAMNATTDLAAAQSLDIEERYVSDAAAIEPPEGWNLVNTWYASAYSEYTADVYSFNPSGVMATSTFASIYSGLGTLTFSSDSGRLTPSSVYTSAASSVSSYGFRGYFWRAYGDTSSNTFSGAVQFDPEVGFYLTLATSSNCYVYGAAVSDGTTWKPTHACSEISLYVRDARENTQTLGTELGFKDSQVTNNALEYLVIFGGGYTVTVDPNGGTIDSKNEPYEFRRFLNYSVFEGSLEGSVLLGMSADKESAVVPSKDKNHIGYYGVGTNLQILDDVSLTAHWGAGVTWDATEGTLVEGVESLSREEYGSTHKAPSKAECKRDGYRLDGWYPNPDFTGDIVLPGEDTPAINSNTTYYAKWTKLSTNVDPPTSAWTYVASFDASDFDESNDSCWTVTEAGAGFLATTVFGGTETSIGFSTQEGFTPGASVKVPSIMPTTVGSLGYRGGDAFVLKTASSSGSFALKYSSETGFWLFTPDAKTGYYAALPCVKQNDMILPVLRSSEVSIYVRSSATTRSTAGSEWGIDTSSWTEADNYLKYMVVFGGGNTVTVDPNGGVWNSSSSPQSVSQVGLYQPTDASREGMTFLGYTCEPAANYTADRAMSDEFGCYPPGTSYRLLGDVTFRATWGISAIWETNGGAMKDDAPIKSSKLSAAAHNTPTAEECQRAGYTLEGWYDNSDFNGDPILPGEATPVISADTTYYAKWNSKYVVVPPEDTWTLIQEFDAADYSEYQAELFTYAGPGVAATTTLGGINSCLGWKTATPDTALFSADTTYDLWNNTTSSLGFRGLYSNTFTSATSTACSMIMRYDPTFGFYIYVGNNTYKRMVSAATNVAGVVAPIKKCTSAAIYKRTSAATLDKVNPELGFGGSDSSTAYVECLVVFNGGYTITIDPNGGSWNQTSAVSTFSQVASYQPADSVLSGVTFLGYACEPAANFEADKAMNDEFGCYPPNAAFRLFGDVTFTAQWGATVTWDATDGALQEGVSATSTKRLGEAHITPSATECKHMGYALEGWYDNPEFEGEPILPGDPTPSLSGDATYYAKWTSRYGAVPPTTTWKLIRELDAVDYSAYVEKCDSVVGAGVLMTTTLESANSGIGRVTASSSSDSLSATRALTDYFPVTSRLGFRGTYSAFGSATSTMEPIIRYSPDIGFHAYLKVNDTTQRLLCAADWIENSILPIQRCTLVRIYERTEAAIVDTIWSELGFDGYTSSSDKYARYLIVFEGGNSVAVDSEGNMSDGSTAPEVYHNQTQYTLSSLSKDDVEFLGWSADPESAITTSATKNVYDNYDAGTFRLKGDVAFTANWGATVTWDATEGDLVSGVSATSTKFLEEVHTTPSGTQCMRAGYTLEGWYTDEGCTEGKVEPGSLTPAISENTTYYAKWNKKSNIAVNLVNSKNGNAVEDTAYLWPDVGFVTAADGTEKATEDTPSFTVADAPGFAFTGYYAGDTLMVDDQGNFTKHALELTTIAENTVWTSGWTTLDTVAVLLLGKDGVTVSDKVFMWPGRGFVKGGSGDDATDLATSADQVCMPPSLDGYDFLGFYDASSEPMIDAGGHLTDAALNMQNVPSNTTKWNSHWKARVYPVKLHGAVAQDDQTVYMQYGDGDTYPGELGGWFADQECKTPLELEAADFPRTGYTLVGFADADTDAAPSMWTVADEEGYGFDNADLPPTTKYSGTDVTTVRDLWPVWKSTVTWIFNDDVNDPREDVYYTSTKGDGSAPITFAMQEDRTAAGYDPAGWTVTYADTAVPSVTLTNGSMSAPFAGTCEVVGSYTPLNYDVTLDLGTMERDRDTVTVTLANPTDKGWNTSWPQPSTSYDPNATSDNANKMFSTNTYNVETGDAEGNVTLPTVARNGYEFQGWVDEDGDAPAWLSQKDGVYTFNVMAGSVARGNFELFAKWSSAKAFPVVQKMRYENADGQATESTYEPGIYDRYDGSEDAPENPFDWKYTVAGVTLPDLQPKPGYEFVGWRTDKINVLKDEEGNLVDTAAKLEKSYLSASMVPGLDVSQEYAYTLTACFEESTFHIKLTDTADRTKVTATNAEVWDTANFENGRTYTRSFTIRDVETGIVLPTLTRAGYAPAAWIGDDVDALDPNDAYKLLLEATDESLHDYEFTADWKASTYAIKYENVAHATVPTGFHEDDSQSIYEFDGSTLPSVPAIDEFEKRYYKSFTGWMIVDEARKLNLESDGYTYLTVNNVKGWMIADEDARPTAPVSITDDNVERFFANGSPIILRATFDPQVYKALLNLDGGTLDESRFGSDWQKNASGVYEHEFTCESPAIELPTITRTGSEFLRWTLGGATVTNIRVTPPTSGDTYTYVAKWRGQAVQIAFHYNADGSDVAPEGGIQVPAKNPIDPDEPKTFTVVYGVGMNDTATDARVESIRGWNTPEKMIKRPGYRFLGFFDTQAAIGGNMYYTASYESARAWDKDEGKSVYDLYARWEKLTEGVNTEVLPADEAHKATAVLSAVPPEPEDASAVPLITGDYVGTFAWETYQSGTTRPGNSDTVIIDLGSYSAVDAAGLPAQFNYTDAQGEHKLVGFQVGAAGNVTTIMMTSLLAGESIQLRITGSDLVATGDGTTPPSFRVKEASVRPFYTTGYPGYGLGDTPLANGDKVATYFHANGGMFPHTTDELIVVETAYSSTGPNLPNAPTGSDAPQKTGYTFKHWSQKKIHDSQNEDSVVAITDRQPVTYYAHYEVKMTHHVTFIDGKHNNASFERSNVKYGDMLAALDENEIPADDIEGFAFKGYFEEASGVQYINSDGKPTRPWECEGTNVTLYARWVELAPTASSEPKPGEEPDPADPFPGVVEPYTTVMTAPTAAIYLPVFNGKAGVEEKALYAGTYDGTMRFTDISEPAANKPAAANDNVSVTIYSYQPTDQSIQAHTAHEVVRGYFEEEANLPDANKPYLYGFQVLSTGDVIKLADLHEGKPVTVRCMGSDLDWSGNTMPAALKFNAKTVKAIYSATPTIKPGYGEWPTAQEPATRIWNTFDAGVGRFTSIGDNVYEHVIPTEYGSTLRIPATAEPAVADPSYYGAGYHFAGWYEKDTNIKLDVNNLPTVEGQDWNDGLGKTYYARYERTPVTLTLKLGPGESDQVVDTIESWVGEPTKQIMLTDAQKPKLAGFEFKGWYKFDDGVTDIMSDTAKANAKLYLTDSVSAPGIREDNVVGAVTLMPYWQPRTYTINWLYNYNDEFGDTFESGVVPSSKTWTRVKYGQEYPVASQNDYPFERPANAPRHTFTGWYTSIDNALGASVESYNDLIGSYFAWNAEKSCYVFQPTATNDASTLTFYAGWTMGYAPYTITLIAGEGDDLDQVKPTIKGKSTHNELATYSTDSSGKVREIDLFAPELEPVAGMNGWTFLGWEEKLADGKTELHLKGSNLKIPTGTGNRTFVAKWSVEEKGAYSIEFYVGPEPKMGMANVADPDYVRLGSAPLSTKFDASEPSVAVPQFTFPNAAPGEKATIGYTFGGWKRVQKVTSTVDGKETITYVDLDVPAGGLQEIPASKTSYSGQELVNYAAVESAPPVPADEAVKSFVFQAVWVPKKFDIQYWMDMRTSDDPDADPQEMTYSASDNELRQGVSYEDEVTLLKPAFQNVNRIFHYWTGEGVASANSEWVAGYDKLTVKDIVASLYSVPGAVVQGVGDQPSQVNLYAHCTDGMSFVVPTKVLIKLDLDDPENSMVSGKGYLRAGANYSGQDKMRVESIQMERYDSDGNALQLQDAADGAGLVNLMVAAHEPETDAKTLTAEDYLTFNLGSDNGMLIRDVNGSYGFRDFNGYSPLNLDYRLKFDGSTLPSLKAFANLLGIRDTGKSLPVAKLYFTVGRTTNVPSV